MSLFERVKNGDLDYIKTVPLDVLQNTRDDYRMSALSIATIQDDLNCCKEILRRCPSLLYHQNSMKNTVLHHATYYGSPGGIFRLVDFFVSFGLDAAKNDSGGIESGMERFKRWIKLQNHNADTGLTQAAYYKNHDIVRRFVEVDRQYKLGLSEMAGYKGKTALQLAVEYQDEVMLKLLTDGQDLDLDSLSFPVDLFDRVKSGDLDYIKTVPLDVLQNTRDDYQMSALSIATREDQLDCCKEILRRCPSLLYHQNSMRNTVLHHATYYGSPGGIFRLVDFFVTAGLNAAKNEGDIEEGMARFKWWIKLQNHNGDTGLTQAAFYRNYDIMERFVEVDRQYKLGLSRMAGFKRKTAMELALEYKDDEMIKILSDLGSPDFNFGGNTDGKTPASIAMPQGQGSQQTGNIGDTAGTIVASGHKIFTLAEVSKHNNSKDCWLVINDKVYDVTGFLGDHPGGGEILLKATGKDATNDFEKVHNHSSDAMTMMDKFYAGVYDSIASLLTKLVSYRPQEYSHEQVMDFKKDFPKPIGSGGFGDVYKGKLPNGVLIAVKILRDIPGKEKIMEEQFAAEVNTMGNTYHRNLIRLNGYCYDANTKFKALIYDYMESGSLKTVLSEKKLKLTWKELHNIAKQIAQGISYLHENCDPQIIHQDIKPDNVLLDSNLSPKVIDFGLAKVNMGESLFDQTKIKGTRIYMAPEVYQPNQVKLSWRCDVYSFGMVLFDILGSKKNHVDSKWFPGQVWEKFKANQLDEFLLACGIKEDDKDNAKRLSIVALLCVEHNPEDRPKMSNVVKMLEGEIKQLKTPVVPFYPNYSSPSVSSSASHDSRDDY